MAILKEALSQIIPGGTLIETQKQESAIADSASNTGTIPDLLRFENRRIRLRNLAFLAGETAIATLLLLPLPPLSLTIAIHALFKTAETKFAQSIHNRWIKSYENRPKNKTSQ